ncbi:Dioxygenase [Planctomycetes bacterium Poly30]|uniref:Dioxygenase n=1 Tax=Saltatorellus ferox TaxID=2528018 RepID=A0A518EUR2_9BACT|nr:Dioxygenase [Planctomycetes bacterium Poly30]
MAQPDAREHSTGPSFRGWAAALGLLTLVGAIWLGTRADRAGEPEVLGGAGDSLAAETATPAELVHLDPVDPRDATRSQGTAAEPALAPALAPESKEATQVGAVSVLVRWKDSGELASDVRVSLRPGAYSGSPFGRRSESTDALGRAEFSGVRPGPYAIAVPGTPEESRASLAVEPGLTAEITLTLPAGISFRGSVLDAVGLPVPEAEIVWVGFFGESEVVAESDKSGAFAFRGILTDGGLFARRHPQAPSARRECSVADGSQTGIVLRLRGEGAALEGIVVDEAGQPVAGARMSLASDGPHTDAPHGSETSYLNRPARLRALTDSEGRFAWSGLAPVGWTVLADDRVHLPLLQSVVLAPGTSESLRLTLAAGATVFGTVTDSRGAPVEGVHVSTYEVLKRSLQSSRSTKSDAAGAYELIGVARSAEQKVRAVRVGTPDAAEAVLDLASVDRVEWNPVVAPPTGLTGFVLGPGGEPLEGLMVIALDDAGGWVDVALTHKDGDFSMGEDMERARDLNVQRTATPGRPSHPMASLHLEKDIFPAASPVVLQITAEDLAHGAARGRVIDATGTVPAGAKVSIELVGFPLAFTTDFEPDGSFTLDELPVGTYGATFTAPDRATWKGEVVIEASETSELSDIPSGSGGMLQWETSSLNSSGWPEGTDAIVLSQANGEHEPLPLSDMDPKGPLAAGRYSLRFSAAGYALASVEVDVRDGETTSVLLPAATPQEGPSFQIEAKDGTWLNGRVSRADGAVELPLSFLTEGASHTLALPGLPDGAYVLRLRAMTQREISHGFRVGPGGVGAAPPTLVLE